MKALLIAIVLMVPALAKAQVTANVQLEPGKYIGIPTANGIEVRQIADHYRTETFPDPLTGKVPAAKEVILLDKGGEYSPADFKSTIPIDDVHDWNYIVKQPGGRREATVAIERVLKVLRRAGTMEVLGYLVDGKNGVHVLQERDLASQHAALVPESEIVNVIDRKKNFNIELDPSVLSHLDREANETPEIRPQSRTTLKNILVAMSNHPNSESWFRTSMAPLAAKIAQRDSYAIHHGQPEVSARDQEVLDLLKSKDIDYNKVKWSAKEIEDFKAAARKAARDIAPSAAR